MRYFLVHSLRNMTGISRGIINTNLAPESDPATSQAVVFGDIIFVSGQLGKNPENGMLPPDFESQMKNAMYNLRAILEASKSRLFNSLLVTVYISDAYYIDQMDELYRFFFPIKDPPARNVAIVSSLPKGALIQVSAVASLGLSF